MGGERVGAAAIAGRLALPRASTSARADVGAPLAFDRPGGPLVAVCGLVPGAGTSTLAYALAERAVRDSAVPVLACEADPTAGGLAALAGAASSSSFSELAVSVAEGRPLAAPFATLPSGLRLIATPPRRKELAGAAALRLLRDARAAHGLVVVDCGSVARPEALPALELATHLLWTLPATPLGVRRARLSLATLAPQLTATVEAVVAVATAPTAGLRAAELRELAQSRCDRLVLVPHTPSLLERPDASPAEELTATLVDLSTLLRRGA
jgi:MinD-like ATPase involved in chromosome partitioning or flagellar assembly